MFYIDSLYCLTGVPLASFPPHFLPRFPSPHKSEVKSPAVPSHVSWWHSSHKYSLWLNSSPFDHWRYSLGLKTSLFLGRQQYQRVYWALFWTDWLGLHFPKFYIIIIIIMLVRYDRDKHTLLFPHFYELVRRRSKTVKYDWDDITPQQWLQNPASSVWRLLLGRDQSAL